MKRYFFTALFFIAFCLIQKLCRLATDGFAIAKMAPLLHGCSNEILCSEGFLTQRFTYLGKGGQCYVFISDDDCYILKFFRKNSAFLQTYASAQLAAKNLTKETGLLYVHLGPTSKPLPNLQIVDKLKIVHTIDLNAYSWIIQKRAVPIHAHLSALIEAGKIEEARQAFSSLFALIKQIADRGILDGDPNLSKNFGFLEKQPIQIDIGRFTKGDRCIARDRKNRLMQSKEDLLHWLNAHYPALSPYFEEEFQHFLATL